MMWRSKTRRANAMKPKVYTLLALLAMVLGMAACSEKAPFALIGTPYPSDITLVPYTSEEMGIRGVMPEGWVDVKPGQFQGAPGADPTLLGQVAFPGATMEQVMDAGQFPERVGSMETADFTWGLHHAEFEWPGGVGTLVFDVALTEADAGAYLVALVALADDHDALYDGVFVPAVEALGPAKVIAEKQHTATPTAPPVEGPAPVNTTIRSADGMVMVYVPAGEFEMGNAGVQWVWGGSCNDPLELDNDDSSSRISPREGGYHAEASSLHTRVQGPSSTGRTDGPQGQGRNLPRVPIEAPDVLPLERAVPGTSP
jgi:hypothetical protein